jgi:hypothetical protein
LEGESAESLESMVKPRARDSAHFRYEDEDRRFDPQWDQWTATPCELPAPFLWVEIRTA